MSQLTVLLVGDIVPPCGTAAYESVFDHDNPDEREVAALAGWFRETGDPTAIRNVVYVFKDGIAYDSPKLIESVRRELPR
jgi:hypothetical protein